MRHVVPVDREAGARDVARARESDAAPLGQLAEFSLPVRSVDDLLDASAETHGAHAQIVRGVRVGWHQRLESQLRGIDAELFTSTRLPNSSASIPRSCDSRRWC